MDFWILAVFIAYVASARPKCGGILTASRGILQTPGFPSTLPVPIRCEWIIDATQNSLITVNASIIVYLTQLYINEGLTFTEYELYDPQYQIDGRIIHSVNESNVVQVKWVQSFQNYLGITLEIDRGESVHLRVLDEFLDVYGFNITYEITNKGVRTDSCTIMQCGFTGTCYDHYTHFQCDCFPGFSGPQCSSGPKSFCGNETLPTCKNGGTCMHVGVSAVKCHCHPDYTGKTCEVLISPLTKLTTTANCDNCVQTCHFDGNVSRACQCNQTIKDRIAFISRLHLQIPAASLPGGDSLKRFVQKEISKFLKNNQTKINDITIAKLESGADVTFHLFAPKREEKRLKGVLGKWVDRGSIGNVTVSDKEFIFEPLLDLQSISINKMGLIREGNEFILSCIAKGSISMTFRWYKDGALVNVSRVPGRKWSRLITDSYPDDHQYSALLGVAKADILDSGVFTCQVADSNAQQCLSLKVSIKTPPTIKIQPLSLTVKKGENISIKCTTEGDFIKKYTYSWTKNRKLLPIKTDNEKYEILYPEGSVLRVFNIEKSCKYSCLVQDDAISSEKIVEIHVVDPSSVRTCSRGTFLDVTWPETAPDTDSFIECPKGYTFPGFVRRSCVLNDGLKPIWSYPDYSRCTSKQLYRLNRKLRLFELGYETDFLQILDECLRYVKDERNKGLYPGEGKGILLLVQDVISYVTKSSHIPFNVTGIVFDLLDKVLMWSNSLINQEQVKLLQEVISMQVKISTSILLPSEFSSTFLLTFPTISFRLIKIDGEKEEIRIPLNDNSASIVNNSSEYWTPENLILREKSQNKLNQGVLGIVVYKNLNTFLPSQSVIRLKNGTEIEYKIISQMLRLWFSTESNSTNYIKLEWKEGNNSRKRENGWFFKCAIAEKVLFAYSWNMSGCVTISNFNWTQCICSREGTYALLLTSSSNQAENKMGQSSNYILLSGLFLCLISSMIGTVYQSLNWILQKSSIIFLKLQTCISIASAMLMFILAQTIKPNKDQFSIFVALIELSLLMGMSAHISILLMVFTEFVHLPKTTISKKIIIGIGFGVPIITVFGNHLAHRTMNAQIQCWWIISGNLAFEIFVTVSGIITVLFVFLYFTVVGKLKKLKPMYEKDEKILDRRIRLLTRSAQVFSTLILLILSSIIYINFPDCIWCHYQFSASGILLAITIFFSYIINTETHDYHLSNAKKSDIFCGESPGCPLNFFSKEESESHKDASRRNNETASLPECLTGTTSSIENYSHSPVLYKNIGENCRSPDIIASKTCTELDLVVSHAPTKQNMAQSKGDDKLDGMLDRISHDLNYLLNDQEGEVIEFNVIPRRLKSKVICLQNEVIIEEDGEDATPSIITEISRTQC